MIATLLQGSYLVITVACQFEKKIILLTPTCTFKKNDCIDYVISFQIHSYASKNVLEVF